ncbi:hypothetical protein BpHYR1_050937 [Brachionus plicatilis]|uniref:Uncharacterized protein n=1 Tax=Brachionus plicatilis TaxID=10195 RepID=A0A3M7QT23_BRAPC|nr:hypothetical protein BpHYR1_050937 [Brachionus plicatilis]
MLLNYNSQNQFSHHALQADTSWSQASRFIYPQSESANPAVGPLKKSDGAELDKSSALNEEEPTEDGTDELTPDQNDEEYLYLTINLPSQAVHKLKNLSADQVNQIRQLGILGFQFQSENTTFRLENMAMCSSQSEESQPKKRSRKTVMELSVTNSASSDAEPKIKRPKVKDSDADSSNCSENMSDELKNIYQIRQMLSQQAQKEEDGCEKSVGGDKPKKPRQRPPPDPNKPKARRSSKPKSEQSQESQAGQPPVRINQLIQQSSFMNPTSYANRNHQALFNQNQYANNQEQMKIRNILFYNSSQSVQDSNQNGFVDSQQNISQNANFLILNSNLNSSSDCNSNSNMTTNSDMSLTNASYSVNNNPINFLNI